MRSRAGEGVLGRDVNAVFYGMGEWVAGAVRRARFWCEVGEEFGLGGKGGDRVGKDRGKGKGKGREVQEDEEEDVGRGKWTPKELLPHMRRTTLVLPVGKVEVLLEWRIELDWTGEAEHKIEAEARVPKSCRSFPSLCFAWKDC
jgi:hypothetical protein